MAAYQAHPVPEILQARILEWVAISFSSEVTVNSLSWSDSLRPHGLAYQAPLFMGSPRQEFWREWVAIAFCIA